MKKGKEMLLVLTSQYIYDNKTAMKFLQYCMSSRGWFEEDNVDVSEFDACLANFKNEHPEYAHNVIE